MKREEIAKLVIERAKRFGPDNLQQIKQLSFALSKSDPDKVFYGLYMVFLAESSQPFPQQELAGKLLFILKPKVILELAPVIERALENWDVSVEELPFYFRDVFGIESVSVSLGSISANEINEVQRKNLETMKWWLRLPKSG
jgi:hypothetical protein